MFYYIILLSLNLFIDHRKSNCLENLILYYKLSEQ